MMNVDRPAPMQSENHVTVLLDFFTELRRRVAASAR
jgi:hypothetical protein